MRSPPLLCSNPNLINNCVKEWPAAHVTDLANYYALLIRSIVDGRAPPSGEKGWYLVSAHSFTWHAFLDALAKELFARKLVDSPDVKEWPSEVFTTKSLGLPPAFADVAWNSKYVPFLSNLRRYAVFQGVADSHSVFVVSERGTELGWQPEWDYGRFLQGIGEEVDAVLEVGDGAKNIADLLVVH